MLRWPLALAVVLFLSACSMPETRIYSLSMPDAGLQPKSNAVPGPSLSISVDSPQRLSQPYIVHRDSPYRFTLSKYSRWDSPPDRLIRDAFKESFSSTGLFKDIRTLNSAPSWFHSLKIVLKKFERADNEEGTFGELSFDAVLLSPEGNEMFKRTISKKIKLEDRTSTALAKGMSNALSEGIKDAGTGIMKALKTDH